MRGILSDAEHKRILDLFYRAGLSMDHHSFTEEILDKATKAILKTRDGMLRAAVPSPLGKCVFLNDVSGEEMTAALRKHKQICKRYPRQGEGVEAFVDASDTGYTMNAVPVEAKIQGDPAVGKNAVMNDNTNDLDHILNGGPVGGLTSKPSNAKSRAARQEGIAVQA